MKLYKSFNQYSFQIYNKCNKIIIKAFKQNKIYIIKYIIKSFNKFALISTVYTLNSETVFSAVALNISLQIQTYKYNLMINSLNINIVLLNKKIKTYRL